MLLEIAFLENNVGPKEEVKKVQRELLLLKINSKYKAGKPTCTKSKSERALSRRLLIAIGQGFTDCSPFRKRKTFYQSAYFNYLQHSSFSFFTKFAFYLYYSLRFHKTFCSILYHTISICKLLHPYICGCF